MSKVVLSLPREFLRGVDALAHAEHRSRSELVREAIRTYVATGAGSRAAGSRARVERAAARILKARLRLPAGHTAESVVRHLRRA